MLFHTVVYSESWEDRDVYFKQNKSFILNRAALGEMWYIILDKHWTWTSPDWKVKVKVHHQMQMPIRHTCTRPLLYMAQRMKRESEDHSMCITWSRHVYRCTIWRVLISRTTRRYWTQVAYKPKLNVVINKKQRDQYGVMLFWS